MAEKVTSNQRKSPPAKPKGKVENVKGKDNNRRVTSRGRKSP